MASNYWIGKALAVAQVASVQVTAYDAATTYKITVGGVIISALAAGSVNATATALAAAWNASTHPYCSEVTAVASTDTVTFTADTAGYPFVISKSVSGGTGTLGAVTAVTASSGPYHWDTAANWSLGAVPVSSDSTTIPETADIRFGLDQSAVTLASLTIVGKPPQAGLYARKFLAASGYVTTVPEYRTDYLKISATLGRCGEGAARNTGTSLVKLDLGAAATDLSVFATGRSGDDLPAVLLRVNHASANVTLYGGSKVGVCYETATETGQAATIALYKGTGAGGGGTPILYGGSGLTLATAIVAAGSAYIAKAPTTLQVEQGCRAYLSMTSGTITTLNKRGEVVTSGNCTVTNFRG